MKVDYTRERWEYKAPVAPNEKPVVKRGTEGLIWIIGTSREREQADGHLLAAAPELLVALEELREEARSLGVHEKWEKADAAIAKARPQQ